jgi:hypothetical protein
MATPRPGNAFNTLEPELGSRRVARRISELGQ